MEEKLKARIEELKVEFQEQARLLQAHYEGRMAEIQKLLENVDTKPSEGVDK